MEDVKCNDGEAMEHHGQTLRVITYDEDGNLTIARTSKYTEEENDNESGTYTSMLVDHDAKIIVGRSIFLCRDFAKINC